MAEQMSAQLRQPSDREVEGSTQVEASAEGAATPIPQAVSAPGINTGTPVVRTEVLPTPAVGGNGLGGVVRNHKRRYSMLLVCGYVSVLVGFALVFVVPTFKSGWVAKFLLVCCGALLAGGAAAVSLGFVRETMRRL